jgi:hypothetical protein
MAAEAGQSSHPATNAIDGCRQLGQQHEITDAAFDTLTQWTNERQ